MMETRTRSDGALVVTVSDQDATFEGAKEMAKEEACREGYDSHIGTVLGPNPVGTEEWEIDFVFSQRARPGPV